MRSPTSPESNPSDDEREEDAKRRRDSPGIYYSLHISFHFLVYFGETFMVGLKSEMQDFLSQIWKFFACLISLTFDTWEARKICHQEGMEGGLTSILDDWGPLTQNEMAPGHIARVIG